MVTANDIKKISNTERFICIEQGLVAGVVIAIIWFVAGIKLGLISI